MSVVCLSVCLSVREHISGSTRPPPPIANKGSVGALKLASLRPAVKRIWALENASSDIFGPFM